MVGALRTTIGLKFLVGASGFFLAGFVLVHMLGNLQVYLGPEALNSYAAGLKALPGPLWAARLFLLAALCAHVYGILTLRARNKAARPQAYALHRPIESTAASRSMALTGLIVLAFVVYHLLHFTIGATDPSNFALRDDRGRHDVYSMVVLGFQNPAVSIAYLVAMAFLGMHLAHGVASLFQTAGLRGLRFKQQVDLAGRLFALVVVLGNISIPLACLFRLIEPAQGRF